MNLRRLVRSFLVAAALPVLAAPSAPTLAHPTPAAKKTTPASDRPKAQFYAWTVIDAASGKTLSAEGAEQVIFPASVTKIMTAYLTFEALKKGEITLNQKLDVSWYAGTRQRTNLDLIRYADRTTIKKLKNGKSRKITTTVAVEQKIFKMTTEQALKGLLVHSANDAAVILAENIAGSEAAFVRMMNAKAQELGMSKTNFMTPNGLPNDRQVSTAEDLAKLSRAVIRDFPEYYHFFGNVDFTFNGATYKNYNNLLGSVPGVDGLKTGYIRNSKYNLAASMTCDSGGRVIGVIVGATTPADRKTKMTRLLDYGCDKLADQNRAFFPDAPSKNEQRNGASSADTSPDEGADFAPPAPPAREEDVEAAPPAFTTTTTIRLKTGPNPKP